MSAKLTPETEQLMAPNGLLVIDDTSDHTGDWCALYFITDTVFNAIRGEGVRGTMTGKTFLAGSTIFNGLGFKFIDLTSGSLIAYNR